MPIVQKSAELRGADGNGHVGGSPSSYQEATSKPRT